MLVTQLTTLSVRPFSMCALVSCKTLEHLAVDAFQAYDLYPALWHHFSTQRQ